MTAGKPKVYLLDIEGTVAPVSLVTEQLFPYARTHLADYLKQNLKRPDVQEDLKLLAEEGRAELSPDSPIYGIEIRNELHARAYLLWLMDRDRKSTALKSLQGKIWKAGFESGELKGTLFPDVPGVLARWAKKAKVAIYSSGSVEAQQLLFRHTTEGDLSPLIASYFDTRTGPKFESVSYRSIATNLGVEPGDVIFFSDVVRELNAAREAGCQTRLVLREGNAPVDDAEGHETVMSLE
jgi:2,3-diketo-5-methylthio-1-phosphopentane phosphatase